jgi:hypothetical protein
MIPTRLLSKQSELTFSLRHAGAAPLILLAAISLWGAQKPALPKDGEAVPSPPAANSQTAAMAPKPKEEPIKSAREITRTDAAELSALADKLSVELSKMNINVLSLDVVQKTEAIEKLAKKIRGEAHEH